MSQFGGIHIELPQLVAQLSFDSQADYDNYVARLKAVPTAFEQITTNLMTAMDDNRVLPKYLIDKMIVQCEHHRPRRSRRTHPSPAR